MFVIREGMTLILCVVLLLMCPYLWAGGLSRPPTSDYQR